MFKIFQIGSSLEDEDTANDIDLLIISDKPVDICVYTPDQWKEFEQQGHSDKGQRVVMYPPKRKGDKLTRKVELKGKI